MPGAWNVCYKKTVNCQSCGIQMARPQRARERERGTQDLWKSCQGIMGPDSGVWPQVWVFTVLHFCLALVSSIHCIPPSLPFEILALCCSIWEHGACFDFTAKHSWHVPRVLEDLKFELRGHIEYEDLGGTSEIQFTLWDVREPLKRDQGQDVILWIWNVSYRLVCWMLGL